MMNNRLAVSALLAMATGVIGSDLPSRRSLYSIPKYDRFSGIQSAAQVAEALAKAEAKRARKAAKRLLAVGHNAELTGAAHRDAKTER